MQSKIVSCFLQFFSYSDCLLLSFGFSVSMLQKYLFPPAAPINNVTNSEKNRSLQQNYNSMKQKKRTTPHSPKKRSGTIINIHLMNRKQDNLATCKSATACTAKTCIAILTIFHTIAIVEMEDCFRINIHCHSLFTLLAKVEDSYFFHDFNPRLDERKTAIRRKRKITLEDS